MDVVAALEALRGVTVLEAIASGRLSRQRLDSLGIADAGAWTRLSHRFYGPTRQRRLQTTAVSAAGDLSVDALRVIDKHSRKLLHGAPLTEWELLVELCTLRGTVAEIDRQAASRVRELNRTVQDAEKKAYGQRSLKGGKNTDAQGLRTITLTLPERQMSSYLAHLLITADHLRRENTRLTYQQALADAAYQHGLGSPTATTTPPPLPIVVIPLPEYAKVLGQEGDETVFGLTDGTTITGAELVTHEMAQHHLVGIYNPVKGGINMYRDKRTANWKQRTLLAAETLLCPQPGCTTPASQCQVHHIVSWKKGGQTNIDNMTMACRKHNGTNDDDPNAPPRNGRLERRTGGIVFLPPDGSPPQTNTHPIRKLSAMALSNAKNPKRTATTYMSTLASADTRARVAPPHCASG